VWVARDPSFLKGIDAQLDQKAKAACDQHEADFQQSYKMFPSFMMKIPCPEGLSYLPYQAAAISYASKRKRVLFGDVPGLGKTIEAIGWANYCDDVNRILVVCPASLKLNWEREISKWFVREANIHVVMDNDPPPTEANIVVLNYERLIGPRSKALFQSLMAVEWDMLVVDESHKIKTAKVQRSVALLGSKRSKSSPASQGLVHRARLLAFLSGTPIPNKPKELFTVASALDPDGFANEWSFKMRYCGPVASRIWQKGPGGAFQKTVHSFEGASNLDELQERMRSRFMVRRRKEQVLKELPDKIRNVIPIQATPQVLKVLSQMNEAYKKDPAIDAARGRALIAATDKVLFEQAKDVLHDATVQFMIHQMAKERKALGEAKVPLACEHIRNIMEGGQKLVVFAHHHSVIEALYSEFADVCVSLYGPDSEKKRMDAVDRFQNDSKVRLFVGSIQAAGVGLTLTAADRVLFVESSWVPSDISQCEDRVHRLGQKNCVLVEHIVINESLEASMMKAVLRKQAVLDQALDVLS
jgi:SWI/SNF-related matrix-associated actin-dependent regulator 1 of chromatin subfamily A